MGVIEKPMPGSIAAMAPYGFYAKDPAAVGVDPDDPPEVRVFKCESARNALAGAPVLDSRGHYARPS